jgi:DNA-binding transcriptional LysR family regulator
VELRHLRYFVAVAEELHFRRAAERLHVAQPAVSEQVRKLEEELGVKLLDRNQRGVAMTAAGVAFLDEARRVLRGADVAQQAARHASELASMRLRLGYLPELLPSSVHRALRRLATSAPRVQVELETAPADRLVDDVRSHRLDAIVAGLPASAAGLRVTALEEQPAVAVVPVAHPRAADASVALERLAPDRLLMFPRACNPAFHSTVVTMCRGADLAPALVEIAESRVEHVLLGVAAGAGLALLPESVGERYAIPGVRFVPVEGAAAGFRAALVTHPNCENLAMIAFRRALSQPHAIRTPALARPRELAA